jgi:hypothetical protein
MRGRGVRALLFGLTVAAAVVIVGLAALVATDTLRIGGGTPPAVAGRATTTTLPDDEPADAPRCRSPLTVDDPLRLWIGGDSLAGSLGPSLGEQAAATGIVATTYDSRVSSGLATPGFFDWPTHATTEMARLDPEVAVFIMGANDFNVPRAQPVDATGQPEWKAKYELLVEQMLDILDGEGDRRPVYWVGAPTMQDRRKDAGVREINEVARTVVARNPDATFVDAAALFAGADGKYTASLPDENGKSVRVRTGDGIHFTPAGGDRLADAVFGLLDDRCRVEAQAVPGATQPVTKTPGSSQVPGTHREPTTPETTPTTAAPVTTTTAAATTTTTEPPVTLPLP